MTTPHPFAALLRTLDAEASKAPWEAYECDGPTGFKGTQAEYLRTTPDGFGSGCSAFGILEPSPNFGNVAHVGALYHNGRVRVEEERANARAIVTLRNAAPQVAALVEAVEAYRVSVGRYDECAKAHPVGPHLAALERQENTARGAMFAALDALARAARDATSGPADPTRIEGSPK